MIKKRTARKISKALNTIVVLTMVLQPVGTPSILRAVAAGESSVSAPDQSPKAEPTDPVVSEETPVSSPDHDPIPAPVADPDVESIPAPIESPVPDANVPSPGNDVTAPISTDTTSGENVAADSGSADPSQGTISPDAATTDKNTTEKNGRICLDKGSKITDSSKSDWDLNHDSAETRGKVELGVKYIFPGNHDVSVIFSCLPAKSDDRATLKIQEIKTSDIKLPESVSAASEYAYDVTTGMKDGDFEYTLTLPKSENSNADINYIEKSASQATSQELSADDLKTVDESDISKENSVLKISDLDHFTIFIATYSSHTFSVEKSVYNQGETVFVKAGELRTDKYYKLAINPPGNNNTAYITACFNPDSANPTLTGTYDLSSSAEISDGWKAELKEFDLASCGDSSIDEPDEASFEVISSHSCGQTRICHATGSSSNPYIENTPATFAQLMGHAGFSHQNSGDIIPPIPVFLPFGQNWDAAGQSIWNNGCAVSCAKGHLIVKKTTVPAGNLTQFSIMASGSGTIAGGGAGTVTDANDKNYEVTPGTYSVSETEKEGWVISGNTCSNISVAAGETKYCEITNTKIGSIKIVKDAIPNDSQDFGFTGSGPGVNTSLNLDDDSDLTLSNTWNIEGALPGSYTFSENTEDGWNLTDIHCSCGSDFDADLGAKKVVINLRAAENVVCTFTNKKMAKIIVKKEAVPAGSGLDATFDFFWGLQGGVSSNPFSLAEGQQYDTGYLDPGKYWITEPTMKEGWDRGAATCDNGQNPSDLILSPGDIVTCNFKNIKQGSVSGAKFNDFDGNGVQDSGEPGISGWEIFVDRDSNGVFSGHDWKAATDSNGDYIFRNLSNQDYQVCETEQIGWTRTFPVESNCQTVSVSFGSDVTANFGNRQLGSVVVTKYNDLNENGIQDNDEPILPGWDIVLDKVDGSDQTVKTDENGQSIFYHMNSGAYILSENIQPGWKQTNITCQMDEILDETPKNGPTDIADKFDNSNAHPINILPGANISCSIGNAQLISPQLLISKSNNKYPVDQNPGSDVQYSLVVTALLNDVNDVTVTDLSPAGFAYRSGSWTADSSLRGNLKNSPTTEPNYDSRGNWTLGDMKKDEVVTLTYMADISDVQDPGLYPDLAWTQGVDGQDIEVLGAGTNSDFVQDAFVGTKVNVINSGTIKPADVKIEKNTETDHKKKKIKRVTSILPATGANGAWPVIALIFLATGISLLSYDQKNRKKSGKKSSIKYVMKMLLGFLFGIPLIIGSYHVQAGTLSNLAARMEDPKTSISTNSFLLGFVALDRGGNEVKVQCFKKGPADGGFVQFQTLNLNAGGSSGNCAVDSAVVPTDGTYQFHIKATAGSESITASDVSVEVVTNGPGTPTNYRRTKVSDCENNIKATTASDEGKTVRVEIYRSAKTSFTLDAATLIKSLEVGSNQPINYTDTEPNCGDTYYYAIRAFDSAGNGSGVVADERTVTRTTGGGTRTITSTVNAPGAIPVAAGGAAVGNQAGGDATGGTVAGKETVPSSAEQNSDDQGQVLGEEAAKAEESQNILERHKALSAIGIFILLGIIYYAAKRRKNADLPKPSQDPTDEPLS
jgi:hypothetical protein